MTDSAPDDRLIAGRYRLLSLIGHGAMGTVWQAYDEFLRRPVAVKEVRLPPGMPQGEADELRERTMREARAIAVLSHPNVVTLHDIAQEGGDPYVVMELVSGNSLAHLLRIHGPLNLTQAAAVADALAAALQAAHQAGITHRDVKPANVLVADDGRIKLADFGIARNISEHTLTSTGITLGTPAYIAPEVASGGEVTHAADLWSLGATLFAAIEGRAPYDPEGDVIATLLEVVNGSVPRPRAGGPMTELVTELMVKDTSARLSLPELRRRIYPLLPEPGTSVFTTEAISAATTVPTEVPPRPAPPPPVAEQTPDQPPLADDPGPLPFAFTPGPVRQTRRFPRPLVYVVATVLFIAAAAGSFALTRVVSGNPLLPPKAAPAVVSVVPPSGNVTMVARNGDAATVKGMQGGTFVITVPQDWQTFVEERAASKLPASTRVHYVSPDGRYALTVERFAGFYLAGRKISDYQASLLATWPAKGALKVSPPQPVDAPAAHEPAVYLKYITVDFGNLSRTTYANVLPRFEDLWVVSLTVPNVEEDSAKNELFDRIAPSFALT
ncbi:MAG: serine/threonine-protein kinase [Kibdelosporangium sp.]